MKAQTLKPIFVNEYSIIHDSVSSPLRNSLYRTYTYCILVYRGDFKKVSIILLLGIIIDIDHLWATPLFDANRCSINFHPLHTYFAILIYLLLFSWKKTRIFGLALLLHILADSVDCLFIHFQG